ncbi:hypothetical protein ACMX8W_10985 [Bacillus subtilis]|uniref:hypothetical protein n=1 Tax=Bacillus TaxID=1386 RepID=UPI000FFE1B49|nr:MULTISPECIES: hypothetical protein [Bacillus]MBE1868655.1 hypothetical protein [Bacillus subtilis]NMJ92957.1 hypothetical protein [Bacillus sp. WR12]NUC10213.1 hypothetical protein [Bacillus subtilis]QAT75026.1 hypothetical protein D9C22_10905 [Bacillus sp. WR11]
MKRKIFSTSLLALTMVSASFTGASAATLNESKVSEDAPFSIKRTTIYNSVPSWYQGSASAKIDGVYDETKFLLTNYSSKSVNYKITKGSTDMKSGTIAGNDSVTFNLKKPLFNSSDYIVELYTNDSSNRSVGIKAVGL